MGESVGGIRKDFRLKKLLLLIILIISVSCTKGKEVDTAKEIKTVREIISKIPFKKAPETLKTTGEGAKIEMLFNTASMESIFVYQYKNRRDPFHSLLIEKEKIRAMLKEKEKEEERKKAEMVQRQSGDELKIDIAAILGGGDDYLVLFRADDNIYQKNDFIDKDKKIRITDIDRNSVKLAINKGNGKEAIKQILMKVEEEVKR